MTPRPISPAPYLLISTKRCVPEMSSTTQLYAYIALTAYLAPCAWQDWRTRKVSNWLTVPAFVAAWPLALWFSNLEWTVAVFLGCYIAWQFKGMGTPFKNS